MPKASLPKKSPKSKVPEPAPSPLHQANEPAPPPEPTLLAETDAKMKAVGDSIKSCIQVIKDNCPPSSHTSLVSKLDHVRMNAEIAILK